jgi:hypothetical protein
MQVQNPFEEIVVSLTLIEHYLANVKREISKIDRIKKSNYKSSKKDFLKPNKNRNWLIQLAIVLYLVFKILEILRH